MTDYQLIVNSNRLLYYLTAPKKKSFPMRVLAKYTEGVCFIILLRDKIIKQ